MRTDQRVFIPQFLIDTIRLFGEESFPDECCGAIFGTIVGEDRYVSEASAIPNMAAGDYGRRFLITSHQYCAAERLADAKHLQLLGFYHSHPQASSQPSAFDRENAVPSFMYIIASVIDGNSAGIDAWELADDRSDFMRLNIQTEEFELREG